jgi:hypothetical protein
MKYIKLFEAWDQPEIWFADFHFKDRKIEMPSQELLDSLDLKLEAYDNYGFTLLGSREGLNEYAKESGNIMVVAGKADSHGTSRMHHNLDEIPYDYTEEEKSTIEFFNGDEVTGPAKNRWAAKDIAAVIDDEMEKAYDAHLQSGGDQDDKEFLRDIFLKHEDELYDLGYTES